MRQQISLVAELELDPKTSSSSSIDITLLHKKNSFILDLTNEASIRSLQEIRYSNLFDTPFKQSKLISKKFSKRTSCKVKTSAFLCRWATKRSLQLSWPLPPIQKHKTNIQGQNTSIHSWMYTASINRFWCLHRTKLLTFSHLYRSQACAVISSQLTSVSGNPFKRNSFLYIL